MIRWHLLLALALLGCSKDSGEPAAKPEDDPPAKPPDPPKRRVELAKVADSVTLQPTSNVAVIVNHDGSIAVAPIARSLMIDDQGLALDMLAAEPVAKLDELAGKVADIDEDTTAPAPAVPMDEAAMGKSKTAREEAIAKAKNAGILGSLVVDPCGIPSGFDDLDLTGGLLDEGGSIGMGSSTIAAGLRAASAMGTTTCAPAVPIVLVDGAAPAARVADVLAALSASVLGVTVDGEHARALSATFSYKAGTEPATRLDVGFELGAKDVQGRGYRGAAADDALWKWSGDVDGVGLAYGDATRKPELLAMTARIRLAGDVPAERLVATLAALLQAGARELAIGEPSELPAYGVGRSGGMRPANPDGPQMRMGNASGSADLDKVVIRRYVRRNAGRLKSCYEQELIARPGIEGDVTLRWTITPNGSVTNAEAKGFDDAVATCMAGVISTISFPKPKGGGPVDVTSYPFSFHPAGG